MAEIFSALKNLVTQEVFFVGLLLINAAVLGYFWVQSRRGTPAAPTQTPTSDGKAASMPASPSSSGPFAELGEITPLTDFDWNTTEPTKIRPFKPKYHLTMALETTDINGVVCMDRNYLDRITYRRELIEKYPSTVVGHLPGCEDAIRELYTLLIPTLLPTQYPTMFEKSEKGVKNLVTGDLLPAECPEKPFDALATIGRNTDEDFLILQPSTDGDSYTLFAFSTCFPSGFDTSKKMGLKLRDIHTPVPRYKEKLQASMDRYFSNLPVGKFARRANWSVMTNPELFTAFKQTHFHDGAEYTDTTPEEVFNPGRTFQRTESQTLFRLPGTKALVFVIKTYMYPIQDVRDEGFGEALAEAIGGLKEGNVPEMYFYKRAVNWGEDVQRFLRAKDGEE